MNTELLSLLVKNARYTNDELAVMCGISEEEVVSEIAAMEKEGIIGGYKTVVDWSKVNASSLSALIELKVTPQFDTGFEEIAKNIMKYPEVESVYLMSGRYDLCVIVKGKTFQEVAMFVGKVLAPMKNVNSTATHFVLRRYKELDVVLYDSGDDRGSISL
ncbi:MAG: Lrp/AsnC family transcriptional regulator [Oscillospiraceae bacterium]|nr:Lrp/AsnC family transcriptional regulator [Candidatus Equicaccousia limihippi]